MGIKEIEKIINKHNGDQRIELINTYRKEVDNAIESAKAIRSQHIRLICSIMKFLSPSEKQQLISKVVNTKAYQVRTYILNNNNSDFSQEKEHFSSFSGWATALVKETEQTFYESEGGNAIDEEIAEIFQKKILDELKLIFCSSEKFNSEGNQLLLDLKKYMRSFKGAEREKEALEERVRKNFNFSKVFSTGKIEEVYKKILNSTSDNKNCDNKNCDNKNNDNKNCDNRTIIEKNCKDDKNCDNKNITKKNITKKSITKKSITKKNITKDTNKNPDMKNTQHSKIQKN